MQGIPVEEKIFIGGDFNGYVRIVIVGLRMSMEDMVLGIETIWVTQF